MEIQGFKPGTQPVLPPGQHAPKLAVGERLSICGKFGINGQGNWRELPANEAVPQPHEFQPVGPDGKPMCAHTTKS